MRILLAEDSQPIALLISTFLKQAGHEVTHVVNGHAAVEAYGAAPPDLVLMDVVMPEMDGIEATRRIKALDSARWVPVVLMTSLSAHEDVVTGLDAGADEYLIKPINLDVLAARLRAMQRIATMQDSLHGILDNVFEAIITINETGAIQSFNRAAERIFGYTPQEVAGRNVKMLMPAPYQEEHDGYLARYRQEGTPHIIGSGRKVSGLRKNGEVFPMRLSVTEVRRNAGNLFIGLVSDISAEEKARERIEFLALHDPLTGLPNRAQFGDTLDALLPQPAVETLHAVLFIDLDGFKPINDTLGHEAGDEALKIAAGRLRNHLAEDDFVARLGGDEFVVIARDIGGPNDALTISNRLLAAISQPMTLLGQASRMGASIGIALIPLHGRTASEVLTAADNAMYAAKRSGKGRVVLAGEAA